MKWDFQKLAMLYKVLRDSCADSKEDGDVAIAFITAFNCGIVTYRGAVRLTRPCPKKY
jgi:hypothetical protein